LAWESYFGQSTDFLGAISTGLADQTVPRTIAAVSAASYQPTLGAGEISALYGARLTSGGVASATSQPPPPPLAGAPVRTTGAPAPLSSASPLQVTFQVPPAPVATTSQLSVQSPPALIEVFSTGQLIRAGAFQIAPAVPAIFTSDQTGTGAAAAVD